MMHLTHEQLEAICQLLDFLNGAWLTSGIGLGGVDIYDDDDVPIAVLEIEDGCTEYSVHFPIVEIAEADLA